MSAKRTILRTVPIPQLPGWESRMVLLEYPPGAVAPPHTHPVTGINYVVEGEVISQWEGEAPEKFSAGETFLDYADALHTRVENASKEKPFKVVVNYVIKTGVPNVEMK